jgi:uncharacterized membrane protein HdeD (DUF308 family)
MIADDIKSIYHRSKWALVLRGVLSIIVGIVVISRPLASVAALALIIAFWAVFDGVVNIVRAFQVRGIAPHWWVMLVGGVVSVLFGATALYYFPGLSLTFAVVWTAYWLTLSGVMALFATFQERGAGLSWGWTAAFGVLSVIAGVYAFMNPGATLLTLITLYAWFAIVAGIFQLVAAGRMQSLESAVRAGTPAAARA